LRFFVAETQLLLQKTHKKSHLKLAKTVDRY